jgi:hypothetical protein
MKKVLVSESALESIKAMAARLYEENEALRSDAERYRWLRDTHPADGGLWVAMGHPSVGIACWRCEYLDAKIDAAMKAG